MAKKVAVKKDDMLNGALAPTVDIDNGLVSQMLTGVAAENNEKCVEEVNEVIIAAPQEKKVDEDVIIIPPVIVDNAKKDVRVRMAVNANCVIGGVRYVCNKGQVYTVPENVKRIFTEANMLVPLN